MLRSGHFWFALVFAVLLLLPGLYLTGRTVYRLLTYQAAAGTANFDARREGTVSTYIISYTASNGKSYRVEELAAASLGLGYEAGQNVKVLYPASDPADGVAATFFNLWFWPLLVALSPLALILPVAGWASRGIEDARLAALAAEKQIARDRKKRALSPRRERRDEDH